MDCNTRLVVDMASELDFSMLLKNQLIKYKDQVLTDKIIWNLVMDIQHDADVCLIKYLQENGGR